MPFRAASRTFHILGLAKRKYISVLIIQVELEKVEKIEKEKRKGVNPFMPS
jgi:hypothetical protein